MWPSLARLVSGVGVGCFTEGVLRRLKKSGLQDPSVELQETCGPVFAFLSAELGGLPTPPRDTTLSQGPFPGDPGMAIVSVCVWLILRSFAQLRSGIPGTWVVKCVPGVSGEACGWAGRWV